MYLVKTPLLIQQLFSKLTWKINTQQKVIYLTFDDGPHPQATPFVLQTLQEYKAKATFFCIGKNVVEYPNIYEQILQAGHRIGSHTHNHLNGWKTDSKTYINNITQAATHISSKLFRPPYGRIHPFQAMLLRKAGYKIVMWDVLSGDFDIKLSKENCAANVILHATEGSIVVFHDSEKAFEKLQYALPKVLQHFSNLGYVFAGL